MIGDVRRRVVLVGVVGFVAVHVLLGIGGLGFTTSRWPYLVGLALVVAASVAVLVPWSPAADRVLGPATAAVTVLAGVLVVAVLQDGRPGYALWFPSLVPIPLCGIALRGHSRSALVGAAGSAATTLFWAATSDVGYEDGLYRVVTPTAGVVVAVGIATLVRQYGAEVERSHAERAEAFRLSAAATAAQTERVSRLAEIERLAAPLLRQLAAGAPVDERTAAEARLVEAALRDGIRGRAVVDAGFRETVWAARSRGVQVTVLDDAGLSPADPDAPVVGTLRACAVTLLELLDQGRVTVRLALPDEGTVVVIDPLPTSVGELCRERLAELGGDGAGVEVEVSEDDIMVRCQGVSGSLTAGHATSSTPSRHPTSSTLTDQPAATSLPQLAANRWRAP